MPPRKRAASAPKPDPEQEPLEPPAEGAQEEPTAGETEDATREETTKPEPPAAEPKPAKKDTREAERPCAECFPAGWPDDATSVGCGHGTWNRDL